MAMERGNDHEPTPQLTGIVIITLPPSDNPSAGKTITAFTISDSDHPTDLHRPQSTLQIGESDHHPVNFAPRSSSSLQRSISRAVLPVLGISLIALYLWISISREVVFQLRDEVWNEDDDHEQNNSQTQRTFLFPLYHKPSIWGNSGDFEVKLGKFVSLDFRRISKGFGKINPKLTSSASKIDSGGVIPVGGNVYPDGLYYTYLHFGNPPRPYFLDMDTGSDLTWIQCDAPCTSCTKGAHPLYKPVEANILPLKDAYCVEIQKDQINQDCETCQQCDYEIEYADHSSSVGVLARDELHLNIANGSLAKSEVVFGCAYDQQGLLLNTLGKTDGILGLSRAKISLPSQLAKQGIINNVVGHCLATDINGGGYLFLGDDFVPYRQMTWVPMLSSYDPNLYHTKMVKVGYGSRQIGLGSGEGHLVFDTGSSYSYFPQQQYTTLLTTLNDISNESLVRDTSDTSLPICWRPKSPLRSVKDVKQFFKPMNLHIGSKWWFVSTKLQIPPESYLVMNNKGNVCLGILNGRKVHDGSTFILGDISLRGLLIVYDNVNERIGWTRSDCGKPHKFQTLPVN